MIDCGRNFISLTPAIVLLIAVMVGIYFLLFYMKDRRRQGMLEEKRLENEFEKTKQQQEFKTEKTYKERDFCDKQQDFWYFQLDNYINGHLNALNSDRRWLSFITICLKINIGRSRTLPTTSTCKMPADK